MYLKDNAEIAVKLLKLKADQAKGEIETWKKSKKEL